MQAFELTYARYDEHQRTLETYWALRWLLQENVKEVAGTVLRENVVRLEGLPLTVRVSSLPALEPRTPVRWSMSTSWRSTKWEERRTSKRPSAPRSARADAAKRARHAATKREDDLTARG